MPKKTDTTTAEYETVKLPDFTGKKVLVLGGAFFGSVVSMFCSCGWTRANDVEDADLVVFIGGADINPALYNQDCMAATHFDTHRDEYEQLIYAKCLELEKPMFGICRGAQFLHAMNGGDLWQHVDNHAGPDHYIYDIENDVQVLATSMHHQMLAFKEGLELIAVTVDQISKRFCAPDFVVDLEKEGANAAVELEIEAGAYYDTQCLFVQGHPEVGSPEYKSWTMSQIKDFLELLEICNDSNIDEDEDNEEVGSAVMAGPGEEDFETMAEGIARMRKAGAL